MSSLKLQFVTLIKCFFLFLFTLSSDNLCLLPVPTTEYTTQLETTNQSQEVGVSAVNHICVCAAAEPAANADSIVTMITII